MNPAILIIGMSLSALISTVIAGSKHRNTGGWFVAGALFGLIAVLIVSTLPPRPEVTLHP